MVPKHLMANKKTVTPEQVEKAIKIIAKHLAKKRKQEIAEALKLEPYDSNNDNTAPTDI